MNRRRGWIDISVPLSAGMVHYPGDPVVLIERAQDIALGDVATVSRISMSAHSGTHVDAPLHFFERGTSIDQAPFDALIGKARVVEIKDDESIKPAEIESCGVEPGEILLFKTRNSRLWDNREFTRDYVYLTTDAASLLVEKEVRTIGMDYLSIGGFEHNEVETHRVLLEGGLWIIEGLDLSAAPPGVCDFVCLPLRIVDGEAAPARAIIRPFFGESPE